MPLNYERRARDPFITLAESNRQVDWEHIEKYFEDVWNEDSFEWALTSGQRSNIPSVRALAMMILYYYTKEDLSEEQLSQAYELAREHAFKGVNDFRAQFWAASYLLRIGKPEQNTFEIVKSGRMKNRATARMREVARLLTSD